MPAKDYSADRFDVQITVQNDGTLLVKETVVFKFVGGPFTFVFRDIPTDKTDTIAIQSAYMDDRFFSEGTESGQVEIMQDNPIQVKWHFAPTSDATHTFVLNYRVQGIVQKEQNADALYWKALPTQYDYTIRSSTITVTYPQQATLLDSPQVRQGTAMISTVPNEVTFSASDLSANTSLEIGLRFAPGSLITQPPHWQQQQQQQQEFVDALILPFFSAGIVVFLLGTFLLILYYRRQRRHIPFDVEQNARLSEPPDDLLPAIAGTLLHSKPSWKQALATLFDLLLTFGGKPQQITSWNQALATLFDLADRGIVGFVDKPGTWLSNEPETHYLLELRSEPDDLARYERILLVSLFPDPQCNTIAMSRLSEVYINREGSITKLMKLDMLDRGFFDPQRQRFGEGLGTISLRLLFFSAVGIIISLIVGGTSGAWPIVFPALGLLAIGIVACFLWATYSRRSEQGEQEARRWQAFSHYLTDMSEGQQPIGSLALFGQYLPYATSFGLLRNWITCFQRQGLIEVPSWFHALASAPNANHTTFTDMMIYTCAIHPTIHSSSSSHSGGSGFGGFGGGGGGGAAGGGASGAG